MTCTLVPPRRGITRAFAALLVVLAALALETPNLANAAGSEGMAVAAIPQPFDASHLSSTRALDEPFVPGQLLVQFRATATPSDRARVMSAEGVNRIKEITPEGLVKITLRDGVTVQQAAARFRGHAEVEYAVPNLRAQAHYVPNDSLITDPDFDWAWNLRIVHAYEAYDLQAGDPSIVVAILDSGVAYADRDVPEYEKIHLWPGTLHYKQSKELPGPFVEGWDFIYDDPYADDDDGHGTNVATILAGLPNNIAGSAGIAPGTTIMPIKVIDWQKDSAMDFIVGGIRFAADHGANIANLSLGFQPLDFYRYLGMTESEIRDMFRPLRDAVNYAQRNGVILVASSGNFATNEVSLPAGYAGVIAVGATDPDGRLASYSSYGRALDLVAPGGDFGDVNHDRIQDQTFNYSIKPFRSEGSLAKPDSFGVFPFFGTSAAAPHVSGAIALLMARGVTSQGAIEQALSSTAVRPPERPQGADNLYGAGLLQVDAALKSVDKGGAAAGSVQASRAANGALAFRIRSGNPTRGEASMTYRIDRAGRVRARIFDARGNLVRSLEDSDATPGERAIRWDGRDDLGARAATGVYFVHIETPSGDTTRKIAFLR